MSPGYGNLADDDLPGLRYNPLKAVLALSAFWTPIRSALVLQLPGNLRARLPQGVLVPA